MHGRAVVYAWERQIAGHNAANMLCLPLRTRQKVKDPLPTRSTFAKLRDRCLCRAGTGIANPPGPSRKPATVNKSFHHVQTCMSQTTSHNQSGMSQASPTSVEALAGKAQAVKGTLCPRCGRQRPVTQDQRRPVGPSRRRRLHEPIGPHLTNPTTTTTTSAGKRASAPWYRRCRLLPHCWCC